MSDFTLTVNVTTNDIDNGSPRKPHYCPISLAIERMLPDISEVWVICKRVTLRREGNTYIAPLPKYVAQFVNEYDNEGWSVKPITFDLTFKQKNKREKYLSSK